MLAHTPRAESPAVGKLQLPHSFEWRINPEQLAICKRENGTDWRLGAGGFGTVYKAVKDDVHDVAMKIFKNEDGVGTQTHKFQNEIAIMKGACMCGSELASPSRLPGCLTQNFDIICLLLY